MTFLHSERVDMRGYETGDWPDVVRLHRDPDVVRYLVDAAPGTSLEAGVFLNLVTQFMREHPGLGIWRCATKKDQEFIGNFSLMPLESSDDIEIGGRLLKSAWGDGYSMEVGHVLLKHAFDTLKLKRVVSMCHPDNRAAASALIATGFTSAGTEFHYNRMLPFFVFTAERWYEQAAMNLSWREHARRNLRNARREGR
jgi:RimJ/RimL family protein N-acetyltransferase